MKPDAPLTAWLYLTTRRAAIDVIRRESRRQAREQTAYEIAAMNSNSPGWPQVEPLLDEAMETLAETDRSAILLRYFENKSLREVGRLLGTSEDAAQKRVSRALEQLRGYFSKRGVAIGATALAADLAAGAVQTAPIGLGLSFSSAAVLTGAAGHVAAIEAAKTIAMTTIQKTLLVTTVAALLGAALYEHHLVIRRDDQILELQQQAERGRGENRRRQQENDELAGRLAAAQQEVAAGRTKSVADERGPANGDNVLDAELKVVSERVNFLKEKMAQETRQQIPELRLLKDQDWITTATKHKLDSEGDMRDAFQDLRNNAKVNFSDLMSRALWKYAQANEGQLPTDIMQLAAFLEAPGDSELLARYGMVRTGRMREVPSDAVVIAEVASVEGKQDSTLYMSGPRRQMNEGNLSIHSGSYSDMSGTVLRAMADFIKTRDEPLTDPAQLQPYLAAPIDPARLQGFWTASGLPNNLHSPHD